MRGLTRMLLLCSFLLLGACGGGGLLGPSGYDLYNKTISAEQFAKEAVVSPEHRGVNVAAKLWGLKNGTVAAGTCHDWVNTPLPPFHYISDMQGQICFLRREAYPAPLQVTVLPVGVGGEDDYKSTLTQVCAHFTSLSNHPASGTQRRFGPLIACLYAGVGPDNQLKDTWFAIAGSKLEVIPPKPATPPEPPPAAAPATPTPAPLPGEVEET